MKSSIIKRYNDRIIKLFFIILSILFTVPSIVYLVKNKTILGFSNYYNFFINDGTNKPISSTIYVIIFIMLFVTYLYFIKKKDAFKNIKQILIYSGIVGLIFILMLPWTSSDIFYYMGVGELDSVYKQNPYYISIKDYCNENNQVLKDDTIIEQGYMNVWSGTTVVYGPIAQLIFRSITKVSFKNLNISLLLFKILNLIVHLLNCYLIYKITKKIKFSIIYGLNPYIFLEFIGMLHIDIIVILFILLAIYFLMCKRKILPSIFFLAIATGIKYFTILLLPVVILYHYKDEESILKRFLKCIQYGTIFLVIFILEYAIYFRNFEIFSAMMVQTERYCKSFYSGFYSWGVLSGKGVVKVFDNYLNVSLLAKKARDIVFGIFAIIYIKFCIDLLTTKNIKFYKTIRKYSFTLMLFIISLSNFQQWYLVWLFATLPWQKPNTIRNILGLSFATEIGNSIYMYKVESFHYDLYFIGIIAGIYILWIILTNKNLKLQLQNIGKVFNKDVTLKIR